MTSSNRSIFHVTSPLSGESPVDSPHKGQWREALTFFFVCAWTNGWANRQYAGDLRRHGAHCGVTVICRVSLEFGTCQLHPNSSGLLPSRVRLLQNQRCKLSPAGRQHPQTSRLNNYDVLLLSCTYITSSLESSSKFQTVVYKSWVKNYIPVWVLGGWLAGCVGRRPE